MAESFNDPQWAEFEQINAKTLVRPRDDFVFRLGQDFEAGMRSKIGEIVYNPADGLVYRCIKETDSVAPDYEDSTSNLYWLWIAGTISGFVSGRGRWTKLADGTLVQYGSTNSFSPTTWVSFNLPIQMYSAVYALVSGVSGGDRAVVSVRNKTTTTYQLNHGSSTSQTADWIAIGRWKA